MSKQVEDEETKNNVSSLEKTIKERKKLPKEIKDKITDNIFFNIIFIIIMMVITLYITVLFNEFTLTKFESYMKVAQICMCLISIGILETAYKKDSGSIALYGIEFLLFSVAVLYVPYVYIAKNNIIFMQYILAIFLVYYIAKSFIIFIYNRNKYLKENLSDVKEIVKEEKKGYLDEESDKTLSKQKDKNK